MSRNRGRDTKPEVTLRKALWGMGYRYRLKSKLHGKPDLVFPRYMTVVFIDGCFWHKCPLHFQMPKKNRQFWEEKIGSNVLRDKEVTTNLNSEGWNVVRIWEHDIKHDLVGAIEAVVAGLQG
ncbi:MAG: very short patch repair endonuclease [Candidatus Thiodiazotropha lotti]|nr:very short patch repair endonuclease [Candidatus Thiodiazotropha lotti]